MRRDTDSANGTSDDVTIGMLIYRPWRRWSHLSRRTASATATMVVAKIITASLRDRGLLSNRSTRSRRQRGHRSRRRRNDVDLHELGPVAVCAGEVRPTPKTPRVPRADVHARRARRPAHLGDPAAARPTQLLEHFLSVEVAHKLEQRIAPRITTSGLTDRHESPPTRGSLTGTAPTKVPACDTSSYW
jgi:hypothetical protein